MSVSRRDFLGAAALGAVATPLISATGMPMRTLGKTGGQVSTLAFGGGSRFVGYGEEAGISITLWISGSRTSILATATAETEKASFGSAEF
jgi:hypothetical protein